MKISRFNRHLRRSYRSGKSVKRLKRVKRMKSLKRLKGGRRKTSRKSFKGSLKRVKIMKSIKRLKGSGRKTSRKSLKRKTKLMGGSDNNINQVKCSDYIMKTKNLGKAVWNEKSGCICNAEGYKWNTITNKCEKECYTQIDIDKALKKKQCKSRRSWFKSIFTKPINIDEDPVNFTDPLKDISNAMDVQIPMAPREISKSNVTLIENIASGNFGVVIKGTLDESSVGGVPVYNVAVKKCSNDEDEETKTNCERDLMNEATLMAMIPNHKNIIPIIGVVTHGRPKMLIVPLCEHGSLLSFLIKANMEVKTKLLDKFTMVEDIANGMAHLIQNKIVHRDLATRNVLIDSRLVCRVSDFGLSRIISSSSAEEDDDEMYYHAEVLDIAWRWAAPEAMKLPFKFNEKSDVWSYGCTLLEIFNDGIIPHLELTLDKLQYNYTNKIPSEKKPNNCPDNIWKKIIKPCFDFDTKNRPTFNELLDEINKLDDSLENVQQTRTLYTGNTESANPEYLTKEQQQQAQQQAQQQVTLYTGNTESAKSGEYINVVERQSAIESENLEDRTFGNQQSSSPKKVKIVQETGV